MTNHVKAVHRQRKPFKCNECTQKFAERNGLKSHVDAVHLKLKPHACDQCDMTFSARRG